jgi:hypothetical protein
MKIQTSRLCVQTSVWVLASALCVTTVAGCNAASSDFTSNLGADAAVQGLSGTVHGGPNPVANATVKLYATTTIASPSSANNYGYGGAGQLLNTTTTDSNGNFAFTTGTACPAGQQAYIVSNGGKTGTNSANSAALLMAALGPCSSLVQGSGSGATKVIINEPTTIAAAYALSGFMTLTGVTVNISAPANNNAVLAACTTSGSSPNIITTGCQASGLAHAFLNAANLVNTTTGAVYSTSPSNSTAIVPQMLINTLANSVEACINSSGSSSTACTTLMTNTTPTQLSSPPPPTNTLQALLYLAQYPSQATGCPTAPTTLCANGAGSGPPTGNATVGGTVPSAATTALFNVANSNAYYAPALTAAPLDFTIAIAYPETGALWGSASDIKDNIYVYDNMTPVTVFSVTSKGAANWSTAISTSAGCGSFATRCSVNADVLGNLWVVDNSGLTQVSTAGVLGTTYAPATTTALESAGVDLGNNVWLAVRTLGSQTGASGIEELKQGASAIIDVNVNGSPEPLAIKQPTFDSAGNLWAESDNTDGSGDPGAVVMLSDTGSLTSPTFATTGGGNGNPVYYTGGKATPGNGVMVDPSGNLWYSAQDDLLQVTSSGPETGGGQNYAGPNLEYGPIYEAGVQRNAAMDGDGKIVIDATSTGSGYLSVYYPNAPSDGFFPNTPPTSGNTGADVYINPCYTAPSTTVCQLQTGGESTIVNNPRSTTIDATGAIWVPTQSAGFMIQVLGPGAPTWSQKSYIPKALAPNLTNNTTTLRPY